jgi:hypothetical protein
VRSGEYGTQKVFLNKNRTIAIACSGWEITQSVAANVIEKLEASWSEHVGPLEDVLSEEWRGTRGDDRDIAVRRSENALLIAHSEKGEAFKVVFNLERGTMRIFKRRNSQKFVLLGGDYNNPSGMILERYLPQEPPPIEKLAMLATHYVLIGGDLNPSSVQGLQMYFSRAGNPFQEASQDTIARLVEESRSLSKIMQRRLLHEANLA